MKGKRNDILICMKLDSNFLPQFINNTNYISSLILKSILCLFVPLALSITPCNADCSFQVRNDVVDPNFGYGDFTYSAQIGLSGNTCFSGIVAVSRFAVTLNIYDGQTLLRSDSSQERLLNQNEITGRLSDPFIFRPYNFQRDFHISETDNASYEFIIKMGGAVVAKSNRKMGPTVRYPRLMGGKPIYNPKPYYFQDLGLSASIQDMEGLSPSCHIDFKGRLADGTERSWSTDIPCTASGNIYSIKAPQDFTPYREGGNFTFTITYNNQRLNPLVFGPFDFLILPYSGPSIGDLPTTMTLDYTNFSLKAYVKDEGGILIGAKPNFASLVLTHPKKAQPYIFNVSEFNQEGGKLAFEWNQNNAKFNDNDTILSKEIPFQARINYWNDNFMYGATSNNFNITIIKERPVLTSFACPAIVYLTAGEKKSIDAKATVSYSKGIGDLRFHLDGPGLNLDEPETGRTIGPNKYLYEHTITFDRNNANNNYTLTLEYVHPSLEGGSRTFEMKQNIKVVLISIDFQKGSVNPPAGAWNGSYTYSTLVQSSVNAKVALQYYNPCASDWADAEETRDISPGRSNITWTINPIEYPCPELNSSDAAVQLKYKFKGTFQGEDYPSRRIYSGPTIVPNLPPELVTLEYKPILYISKGSQIDQTIRAVVKYPMAGQLKMVLSGPGMNLDRTIQGVDLGGNKCQYDLSVLFNDSHVNQNYTLSLALLHPTLPGGAFKFNNANIHVLPVFLFFENASVNPTIGMWNDTYTYSALVNSSVNADITLQTWNPCSHEWDNRDKKNISAGKSKVAWRATPFTYRCDDIGWNSAKYRFVASFGGVKNESMAYSGPSIQSDPELMALDYEPILYVSDKAESYQVVRAIVRYIPGMGSMRLGFVGPGSDALKYSKEEGGADLGDHRYLYKWTVPFGKDQAGNHTISLTYLHSTLKNGLHSFPDQRMEVIYETEAINEPKLISLNYTPVLFVSQSKGTNQNVRAEVFSPGGKGTMRLRLLGPDKNIDEAKDGGDLGDYKYQYDWSVPFDASNVNKSYRISLEYLLDGQSYAFGDHMMTVAMTGSNAQPLWEPALNLRYDPILDIPSSPGGTAQQHINATVIYPDENGTLKLTLSGQNMRYENVRRGIKASGNRSIYLWDVPFNSTHAGKTYRISLVYNHSGLPGGEYRFTDYYMRVRQEGGHVTALPVVVGNVSPSRGVVQAWQESDKLYSFTYTVKLENLSSGETPWVELLVKAPGQSWKARGEKQQYDPAQGTLNWTVKPFYDAKSLGTAEFKFLINGAESQVFKGPDIVVIYKDLNFNRSTTAGKFNYFGNINASINLSIDLLSSEDNVHWKTIGQTQNYTAGSGEVPKKWKDQPAIRYYEFDIKTADGKVIS